MAHNISHPWCLKSYFYFNYLYSLPLEHVGGSAPVQAYFNDSIILVFPHPFAPVFHKIVDYMMMYNKWNDS